jgi:hypothetical protein
MTYTITVTDTSSHTFTGSLKTVTVTDNDNPSITLDNSPTAGTTGDAYIFDITPYDNIGVSTVTVTWAHGSLSGTNVLLTNDLDGTWSLSINLYGLSTSDMTYTITVTDTSSHTFTGSLKTVTVTDNDKPSITDIGAVPSTQLVNGYVKLKATVTDNININTVHVDITAGPAGFTPDNQSMIIESGNNYIYNQSYSIIGTYNYHIWAKDTNNNGIVSSTYQFEIFAELQITSLKTGWNFVSLPFNLSTPKTNLFIISGVTRYTWGQAVSNHIVYNFLYNWIRTTPQGYGDGSLSTLIPGEGYWMYAYSDCQLWATNLTPMITNNFVTHLKTGWNVVGVPFGSTVSYTDLKVNYLGTDYTWANAVSLHYVMNDIFGWQRTTPQSYFIAYNLDPGYCYWIYAYYDCTLKRTI